jgi:hypothetical protein
LGGGVKVGNAVGSSFSEEMLSPNFTEVDGINKHNPMAMTTKINPIGSRKPREEFFREYMRRWDMERFYSCNGIQR